MTDQTQAATTTTDDAGAAPPPPAGIPGLAELGRPVQVDVRALVLDNFKSFSKKTRIPVRRGFTTVSGPNGSGKSNIIDAVQFVLGIATSKGMRAERLTDLINSDGTRPSARVSLEIAAIFEDDAKKRTERVFEVTRVVRKTKSGAQAHYEVDGVAVRLTDLHDLMRDLGFPTSGQNIVLQGDVVRLTSMGSVARRQVLDELAGARDFDKRIALAHEELGAADRLTEDTRLILTELGQRLGQLKVERDQALAFQQLSGRRVGIEEDLQILDVHEAELKVKGHEAQLVEGEKQQKAGAKKREKLEAGADEAKAALDALEAELAAKGDGERLAAVTHVEGLKARLGGLEQKAREGRGEEQQLDQKVPHLAALVSDQAVRREGLDRQVTKLHAAVEERQGRLEGLKRKFEGVGATLRKHTAVQLEAADAARAINQELEQLRAREAKLSQRDRQLSDLASRAETELSLIAGTQGEGAARRLELDALVAEAAKRHRERREGVAKLEERRRNLHGQVQGLRSGLDASRARLSNGEQAVAAAEARRQQASSLGGGDALNALRREGFAGLHGTVADIIKFDPKNAQAIEAAAGGRLFWVVVDDEQVGREAIEFLRRTRAGRLSFAPLSKMRGHRIEKDAPRGRSIVGYAVDLVESDRRYEELLRSVFTDTLVVERMADAMPLIGRYRMVTLDGDVLERHGLMTGGTATRGSQLLVAAARAAEEVEERKKALAELERSHSAGKATLSKVEAEWAQVDDELGRARAALAEAEASLAGLSAELSRLQQQLGPKGDRAATLEAQLADARRELAAIQAELEGVRAAIADATRRLQAIDAPEASEAVTALNAEAQACEGEMRGLEVELDNLREELSDAQVERRAAEERHESAKVQLAETRERLERVREAAAAAEAEAGALRAELAERQAALEALHSELMALAARRDEARAASEKARDAAREAARELELLAERMRLLSVELEQLRAAATALRDAAKARGVEVPPVEEAPDDPVRARRRLEQALAKLDAEIAALGPVNQLAIAQYDDVVTRHADLERKVLTLETEKDQLRARILDLEGRKKLAFLDAFQKVSAAFQGTFAELARGEGRLRLESPDDPFAAGLIIEARPRGKKLSRLELMSGGEKSLTALAFIFALQEVNPAPFFVFDEVDQSLDGVNTEILASAIQRRAGERQYLVISHHRVMLERSNHTIGVTMRKGHGTVVTGVEMQGEQPGEAVAAEQAPAPAVALQNGAAQ